MRCRGGEKRRRGFFWLATLPALLEVVLVPTSARADKPAPLSAQTLTLPNGPTSLKGLGESFSPNIATGSGSYAIPIEVPPGFLAPKISLQYSTGRGKSELGLGFSLPKFCVYRTTDKGLPSFVASDRMGVSSASFNDELVWVNSSADLFRLKNEGSFVLFERRQRENRWVVYLPNGEQVELGGSQDSRQSNVYGTYRWCASRWSDRFGHEARYSYLQHGGHQYLREIRYQVHAPSSVQNRVVFEYENRPDVFADYTYGEADTTALRMVRIEVWHGSRKLRSYGLGYEEGELFSLLSSVQQTGEYGETLPLLRLGYVPFSHQGQVVVMASPPPVDGLLNGRATLEDMNGDGLPDVLVGEAMAYRYYENLDGRRWAQQARRVAGSPDRHLESVSVVLADADGDGFRDLVHEFAGDFRYYPGGDIRNGVFLGYGLPRTIRGGIQGFHWTLREVKLTDLNRDGRTDLLWQTVGGTLQQVVNDRSGKLVSSGLPALPADVDFTDSRLQLLDFNGDGILDLVRKEIRPDEGRLRVWFGLGHGCYTSEAVLRNVPKGLDEEYFLQDVNRDGQADLVRISGSWVSYHLNTGRLSFTAAKGDYRNVPPMSECLKVLFGDMNGNGTTDVVWVTKDHRLLYLELSQAPHFGLLERIDNGMGQVTTLEYRSSTEYMVEARARAEAWKTPMASSMPVAAEIRTTDSFDRLGLLPNESRTTYEYRDGYYDGVEREFRGFARVRATSWGDGHHETQVTETDLHVGRNLETGADEEALKGKAYRQVVRNLGGEIYQSLETQWEQRRLCQEELEQDFGQSLRVLPDCGGVIYDKDRSVTLALQVGVLTGAWEKTSAPRWTYEASGYDAWGNETQTWRYGEVGFALGRKIGDPFSLAEMNTRAGHDEVETRSTFINKAELGRWLIGLVATQETYDIAGQLMQASRTYYDGSAFVGLPLGEATNGKVMRESVWLAIPGQAPRWVDKTRNAYDLHGQLIAAQDANNNLREYAYDVETGFFLVEERVPVEGETLAYRAEYDRGSGQIVRAVDFNGNAMRFVFDGLVRLRQVIDPLGSEAAPLERYTYTYGTPEHPVSVTQVEKLASRGTALSASRYETSWVYSDGLGRGRQTKTRAEEALGYVASGWTEYSARGKEVVAYQAFASASAGLEAPLRSVPKTVSDFDALERVVKVTPPATAGYGETYSVTQYLPFETRVYDERDIRERTWSYPAVTRLDGLGRVVEILKHNDVASTAGGAEQLTALPWRVGYDALGNIRSITDPQGHERRYGYDSLKRLVRVEDPNAGVLTYAHDDAGNVVLRIDALGQEIHWEYGRANRLLVQTMRQSVHGFGDYAYRFHYDQPGPVLPAPEATNLKGQVSWIEMTSGSSSFSYDERGRLVTELQEVVDPEEPAIAAESFRRELTYDPQGRPVHENLPGELGVEYGYNPRGLLQRLTAGRGTIPTTLHGAVLAYNAAGQVTSKQFGNGVGTCLWYDARQRLQAVRTAPGTATCGADDAELGTSLQHVRYRLAPEGLIEEVTDRSPVRAGLVRLDASYRYDRLYQLTGARLGEASAPYASIDYAYDTIQNLIRRSVTAGGTDLRPLASGVLDYGGAAAGGPNAVTSAFGERYTYNAAGQLQGYNGFHLAFDVEGRLVEASQPDGTRLRWAYDYAGERRLKVSARPGRAEEVYYYPFAGYQRRAGVDTWTLRAGSVIVAEVSYGPGPVPTLAKVDELLAGSAGGSEAVERALSTYWTGQATGTPEERVRYYHPDHLGGPSYVTDGTGELESSSSWYPYGSTASQHGWPPNHTFTGAERELEAELGLIQMGARWYAPKISRWVSPDPLFLENPAKAVERPLELNLYSYAGNNPIVFMDSRGLSEEQPETTRTDRPANTNNGRFDYHGYISRNPGLVESAGKGYQALPKSFMRYRDVPLSVGNLEGPATFQETVREVVGAYKQFLAKTGVPDAIKRYERIEVRTDATLRDTATFDVDDPVMPKRGVLKLGTQYLSQLSGNALRREIAITIGHELGHAMERPMTSRSPSEDRQSEIKAEALGRWFAGQVFRSTK